jgi:hypothetical protein
MSRDGVKVPVLISAIANIVVGLIWLATCFGVIFTVPMLILSIFEFSLWSRADRLPLYALGDRAKVLGIFEIVVGLVNTPTLICGILVLVNGGKLAGAAVPTAEPIPPAANTPPVAGTAAPSVPVPADASLYQMARRGVREFLKLRGRKLLVAIILVVLVLGGVTTAFIKTFINTERSPTNPSIVEPLPHDAVRAKGISGVAHLVNAGDVSIWVHTELDVVLFVDKITESESQSQDQFIVISVLLTNNNPRTEPVYITWRRGATLRDDLGNTYDKVRPPSGYRLAGSVESVTLLGGEKRLDTLVFERPVPAAKDLYLTVPLSQIIGQRGSLTFRIPCGQF